MNKQLIFNVTVMIVCMGIIVYMMALMQSQGAKCTSNPYIYGASKMKNVECSCVQKTNPTCPAKFWFNDTSFESSATKCHEGLYTNINFDFSDSETEE